MELVTKSGASSPDYGTKNIMLSRNDIKVEEVIYISTEI